MRTTLLIGTLIALVAAPASWAEPLRVLREVSEPTDWLPGDDGTGATGVRINRGSVPVVEAPATDALAWNPNRPVIVSELRERRQRELLLQRQAAAERRTAEARRIYLYPARYHHPRSWPRRSWGASVKIDLGDVVLRFDSPYAKPYRRHGRSRSQDQSFGKIGAAGASTD